MPTWLRPRRARSCATTVCTSAAPTTSPPRNHAEALIGNPLLARPPRSGTTLRRPSPKCDGGPYLWGSVGSAATHATALPSLASTAFHLGRHPGVLYRAHARTAYSRREPAGRSG